MKRMLLIAAIVPLMFTQACGQKPAPANTHTSIATSTQTAITIDSCQYWKDMYVAAKHKIDTLNHKCQIYGNQVDWVQYYLNIIKKNPSQMKYDRGWLTRAISAKLPPNPYSAPAKKTAVKKGK